MKGCHGGRSKVGRFFVNETRVVTVTTVGSISEWGPRFSKML